MKFFKPKFASNKQPQSGPNPKSAASAASGIAESIEGQESTALRSPPPANQQQQKQSLTAAAATATASVASPAINADSVDACQETQKSVEPIKKETEAACALITLRIQSDQCVQPQKQLTTLLRNHQLPKTAGVDLDDSASAADELLPSDGEEADDECDDEAARSAAAIPVAGPQNAVGGPVTVKPVTMVSSTKKLSAATLFQRKRPAHQHQQHQHQLQQQQQQQMQNQLQQSLEAQQAKRLASGVGGTPGLRTMRMRDLIYWCPKDQPPPKWRRESLSQGQQTVNSADSTDAASQKKQQEQQPQTEPDSQASVKTDSTTTRLAPQVMLDSRGNIVLNEESLYIRESAPAIVEDVREDCAELRATYRSFRGSNGRGAASRGRQWSCKETLRFYKAISTIGTDFSYMASLFKGRSREELKRKYKREEKANPHLIDQMLRKRKPYDLSMFEPSSESDEEDDAAETGSGGKNRKAGGPPTAASGGTSKPSDIVMEGLKRHLQANQLKSRGLQQQQSQQPNEQQPEPTVTVII